MARFEAVMCDWCGKTEREAGELGSAPGFFEVSRYSSTGLGIENSVDFCSWNCLYGWSEENFEKLAEADIISNVIPGKYNPNEGGSGDPAGDEI